VRPCLPLADAAHLSSLADLGDSHVLPNIKIFVGREDARSPAARQRRQKLTANCCELARSALYYQTSKSS
jgi:hypothetical protein